MNVNKVILVGRLGQDPELRTTANDHSVCNFSLATTTFVKDGENKTEWHRVVVWGKRAEICSKYLNKGSSVYIEGRLVTRKWTDNDGTDKYTTEIIANDVQLPPKPKDSDDSLDDIGF